MRLLPMLAFLAAIGLPARAAPPGWSACKWDDPDYRTPKYVVGRILFKHDHTPEGLEEALPEIQSRYPGTEILPGKGDVIYIPCVGAIDVIVAAGEDNKGKKGGRAWWWGADEDSEECDQCTPNVCDDPSVKSEKARKCEEEEAKNREFGPEVGTNGTSQVRAGNRASTTDCGHFRRATALVTGAARIFDGTGGVHATFLDAAAADAAEASRLARSLLKDPAPTRANGRPLDCAPARDAVKALEDAYAGEVDALKAAKSACGGAPKTEADAERCLTAAREALGADQKIHRGELAALLQLAPTSACFDFDDDAKAKLEKMMEQPCERDLKRCSSSTALTVLRSAREALSKVKDPGLVSPGEFVRAALVGPPEELAVEPRLSQLAQYKDTDNAFLFKASTTLRQAALYIDGYNTKVCAGR